MARPRASQASRDEFLRLEADRLGREAWLAEHRADLLDEEDRAKRQRTGRVLELPDCHACGLVGAGVFGFGVDAKRPGSGAFACVDPECRAAVEAAVYDQEEAA